MDNEKDGIELILKLRNVIKRRFIIMLASVVVFAIASFFLNKSEKPYYNSSATFISYNLPYSFFEKEVSKLNYLLTNNDQNSFSEYSGIEILTVQNIKSIGIASLLGEEKSSKDPLNFFALNIEVFEPESVNNIQNGLLNYFNKNAALKNSFTYDSLDKHIDVLNDELVFANGFQQKVLNSLENKQIVNSLHESKIELLNELKSLNTQKKFNNPLYNVTPFEKHKMKSGPSLMNYLIKGILLGFIVGFFISFWLEISSFLSRKEN